MKACLDIHLTLACINTHPPNSWLCRSKRKLKYKEKKKARLLGNLMARKHTWQFNIACLTTPPSPEPPPSPPTVFANTLPPTPNPPPPSASREKRLTCVRRHLSGKEEMNKRKETSRWQSVSALPGAKITVSRCSRLSKKMPQKQSEEENKADEIGHQKV